MPWEAWSELTAAAQMEGGKKSLQTCTLPKRHEIMYNTSISSEQDDKQASVRVTQGSTSDFQISFIFPSGFTYYIS